MANCGLLLNDGSSFILLNDGTSAILLNDNSCAFEPGGGGGVVTPTIPPGGGYPVHRGSLYWKRYQEELKRERCQFTKKKRTLLEELDEMILELQSRVVEAPPEIDEAEYYRELRVSREMAWDADACREVTNRQIQAQIAILKAAIEEIDDEEAILLTLH